MKVRFDFNLEAWINYLEIEGNTMEEIEEKLHSMSLSDIVEEGNVKDTNISQVDYEIIERKVTVRIDNIDYATDEEEAAKLPKELTIEVIVPCGKEEKDAIIEAAENKTLELIDDLDYTIIEDEAC